MNTVERYADRSRATEGRLSVQLEHEFPNDTDLCTCRFCARSVELPGVGSEQLPQGFIRNRKEKNSGIVPSV